MLKDLFLNWVPLHTEKKSAVSIKNGYFDFVVSGQSLKEYLGFKDSSSVTPFGYFTLNEEFKRILKEFRLQKKPQLSGDRIELYIFGYCGDIGCGSVSVRIVDEGDKIVWTKFANQSNPDEISEEIDVEDIEFDRNQYFKAFSYIK